MSGPRLLVAEGNVPEVRERMRATTGASAAEGYAAVLRGLAPDARIDLCCPADLDPGLPAALCSYDGIIVTGSALNIHRREAASLRQIDFARSVFALGVPMFGSCWGLQLASVAAGGDVAENPRGREVGFARGITLTEAGARHPLHAGRAAVFDAPSIHSDEVVRLPEGAVVTAGNDMSVVQAATIRFGKGVFWGVQYHPEYGLADVQAVMRRYAPSLLAEGIFASAEALEAHCDDLDRLALDAGLRDVAERLGLGPDILVPAERMRELVNWLAGPVRGTM